MDKRTVFVVCDDTAFPHSIWTTEEAAIGEAGRRGFEVVLEFLVDEPDGQVIARGQS